MALDTVYTQPNVVGDVLLWETGVEHWYCRIEATVDVTENQTLEIGQVLETGTTGDYQPVTLGSNALAVLLTRIVGSAAGQYKAAVLVRAPAILIEDNLVDLDALAKTTLEGLGFVFRAKV